MKYLVADTSSSVCGVGIFEDDRIISINEIDDGRTHSENFMPLVKKCLDEAKMDIKEIDYIGVVVGPGSFTGIRIGVASCKAMAEVCGSKVIPIISLDSLAENCNMKSSTICSLIDARNNQVYCGIYDAKINKIEEYIADDINIVIERVLKYEDITFVGNGAILHKQLIEEKFENKKISFCDNNKQNVESLGKIVFEKIKKGEIVDNDELIPIYLRKSQAERNKNK